MFIMIKDFQQLLKDKNIQFYIVPTDDDHQSETVGDYYQARAYLSGFSGSAGTLLVMQDEAYLWTDGRYFIQAAKELYEGITLMKFHLQKHLQRAIFQSDKMEAAIPSLIPMMLQQA